MKLSTVSPGWAPIVGGRWNTGDMTTQPTPGTSTTSHSASATRAQALEVLRALVGREDADFHDGQYEAIEALVDAGRRALVVQRTGWGKSAVYFVASLLLRPGAPAQP